MSKKNYLNYYGFICILCLVVAYGLFWIIIGAYYSYPNAEDLSIAQLSIEKGIIGGAIHLLHTLDGRYTTNILHGLNPLAYHLYYMDKLMPIIILLLFTTSIFSLLNNAFSYISKWKNGLYAFALTILFLSAIDLSQSLFWTAASLVYLSPLIFFFFFLSSFLKYKSTLKHRYHLASLIFLFLSLGGSELYLPIFGVALLLLLVHFKNDYSVRNVIFWYILIFILSAILFITAPGSLSRFGKFDEERDKIIGKLIVTALQLSWTSIKIWANAPLLLLLLIIGPSFKMKTIKIPQWVLIGSGFLTIYGVWVSVLFLMGSNSFPSRILTVITPIWIILVLLLTMRYSSYLKKYKLFFQTFFIISFFTVNNSYSSIFNDWKTGKLQVFKQKMDEQYNILTSSKTKEDCFSIVKLENINEYLPNSIASHPYIQPNRIESWNGEYEKYFQINEVNLISDTVNALSKINETIN